jgi:LysR family transcriptional regulator, transcriptional activator of nhaA
MLPFNFHHLYYFYVIAKEGVVSKAARKLHVSQPNLSAQLKQFENYLGVALFTREGKNILLTEDGRAALSYAQMIFNAGQEFSDVMRDKSKKGNLRIQMGVANSTSKACASELISFFLETDPTAFLCVRDDSMENLADDLKDHALDVIFSDAAYHGRQEEQIHSYLVAKIPVVFCGHRSLMKKYRKLSDGLSHIPMILPTHPASTFEGIQEYFAKKKLKPRVVGEIGDAELVLRLVLRGEAIAPLNRFSASRSLGGSQLVITQEDTGVFESLYLINKNRKTPHPLVEKAIQHFRIKT